MPSYTKRFEDLRSSDREIVGGKCASLGELVSAGLPVPAGFAVTVQAFEDFRDVATLREDLKSLVRGVDPKSSVALQSAHERAIQLIQGQPLPSEMEAEIRSSYVSLASEAVARRGRGDPERVAVAVRSSSVDEDGDAASFAGQQETYLWVVGADEVIERVRECWASMYSPQAIAYRHSLEAEDAQEASKISVAVQLMAKADVAGVTFTVSPRTGDRSVIAINASWGLGQAVVSGEVTPDEYWLNKVGLEVTSTRIAHKLHEYVPTDIGVGVELRDVPADRQDIACLNDADVLALAKIGLEIEAHYGCPQDIEWAIERAEDGTPTVMLLQSRPETNWKKRRDEKARQSTSTTTSGLMGYIAAATKGQGS
jgi:pyruvate, water dikinase